jgi:hypothetical protein
VLCFSPEKTFTPKGKKGPGKGRERAQPRLKKKSRVASSNRESELCGEPLQSLNAATNRLTPWLDLIIGLPIAVNFRLQIFCWSSPCGERRWSPPFVYCADTRGKIIMGTSLDEVWPPTVLPLLWGSGLELFLFRFSFIQEHWLYSCFGITIICSLTT